MPSKSKAQQQFFGMVHAAQQGEKPASPEVAKAAKSISKKGAEEFASTPHKGLPAHVKKAALESQIPEYKSFYIKESANAYCDACDRQVSTVSGNCPHCGSPVSKNAHGKTAKSNPMKENKIVKENFEDEDSYEQGMHRSPKDSYQQGTKLSPKVTSATNAMASADRDDMARQRPISPNLSNHVGIIESYNEYGRALQRTESMRDLAARIAQVAETAEMVTMNEAGDWFDKHTVSRNMKEIKRYATDFGKLAEDYDLLHERMTALYDDMGNVLQRYFEIKSPQGADEMNARQEKRMSAETLMQNPYKCNECGNAISAKLAERIKYGSGSCPKCGGSQMSTSAELDEIEDTKWFTNSDKKLGTIPRDVQDAQDKHKITEKVDTSTEDERVLRDKIARDQKVASGADSPEQRASAQKRIDAANQKLRKPKKALGAQAPEKDNLGEIEEKDRFTTLDARKGIRNWLQQKAEEAQGIIKERGIKGANEKILLKGVLEKLMRAHATPQEENAEISPHNMGPQNITQQQWDANPAGAKVTIGGRKGIVRPAGNNPVKDAGGGTYVQPVQIKGKEQED